jgi:hypothetical protein
MNLATHLLAKVMLLATIVTLLFNPRLARAQETAHLYLQPVNSTDGHLTFEVMAENVTELYGVEFRLTYDPQVLAVQDMIAGQEGIQIEPGRLLPVESGFVAANQVNGQTGTILFAMILLNPAPAVSGAGSLGRVTFRPLQAVASTLEISQAQLVSIDLQMIPVRTTPLTLPAPDLQASSALPLSTWWVLAGVILLVGTLILAGLILRRQTSPIPDTTPGQSPVLNNPTASTQSSHSRPSAFKQQTFPPDLPREVKEV